MTTNATHAATIGRRLASLETAAVYAEASMRTIRRRIADGTLTGYRFGPRMLRVDLNEIDALLRPVAADPDRIRR